MAEALEQISWRKRPPSSAPSSKSAAPVKRQNTGEQTGDKKPEVKRTVWNHSRRVIDLESLEKGVGFDAGVLNDAIKKLEEERDNEVGTDTGVTLRELAREAASGGRKRERDAHDLLSKGGNKAREDQQRGNKRRKEEWEVFLDKTLEQAADAMNDELGFEDEYEEGGGGGAVETDEEGRIVNRDPNAIDEEQWDELDDSKADDGTTASSGVGGGVGFARKVKKETKEPGQYRYRFEKERKRKTAHVTAGRLLKRKMDLEFRLMKAEYTVVSGEGAVIHMYGHTRGYDTASVRLDVRGVKPYFFIRKPQNWSEEDIDTFFEELERKVRSGLDYKARERGGSSVHESFERLILSYEVGHYKNIVGYDFNQGIEAIKITVAYPKLVPDFRGKIEAFRDNNLLGGKGHVVRGPRYKLSKKFFDGTTFESDFPFVYRYMCDQGIDGECWLRVKAGTSESPNFYVQAYRDPDKGEDAYKSSPVDVHLSCDYRLIERLKEDEASIEPSPPPEEEEDVVVSTSPEDSESYRNEPKIKNTMSPSDPSKKMLRFRIPKGSNRTPTGKVVLSYDIEVAGRRGIIPNDGSDPVIDVGITLRSSDRADDRKYYCFTLKSCPNITHKGRFIRVYNYDDEAEMLMDVRRFVMTIDPDILTGYNVDGFDLPYLIKRTKHLAEERKKTEGKDHVSPLVDFDFWTRDYDRPIFYKESKVNTRAKGTVVSKDVSIVGRTQFDMLIWIRSMFNLRSNKLEDVGKHFLKLSKEEMDYEKIPHHFKSKAGRKRLAVYCVHDAFMADELMINRNALMDTEEVAYNNHMCIEDILKRGLTARTKCNVYNMCFSQSSPRFLVPTRTEADRKGQDQVKYEGAHVFKAKRGLHTDPISTLDFASLYPSIMMDNNFCTSTKCSEEELKRRGYVEGDDYIKVKSTGKCYITPKHRRGVFPIILENLLALRAKAKKRMAIYEKQSEAMKNTLDELSKTHADSFKKVLSGENIGGANWKKLLNEVLQPALLAAKTRAEGESAVAAFLEKQGMSFVSAKDLVDWSVRNKQMDVLKLDLEEKANTHSALYQEMHGEKVGEDKWKALMKEISGDDKTEREILALIAERLPLLVVETIVSRFWELDRVYVVGSQPWQDALARAKILFSNFNCKQNAIKLSMNAMYGALGAAISFLYDRDTAASVTGEGQDMIKLVAQTTRDYFYKGSVFVKLPKKDPTNPREPDSWAPMADFLEKRIKDEKVLEYFEKNCRQNVEEALRVFKENYPKARAEADAKIKAANDLMEEELKRVEKEMKDKGSSQADVDKFKKERKAQQTTANKNAEKDFETSFDPLLHRVLFWICPCDVEIIYGDTDSVFVKQFGLMIEEAMRMGKFMADFVTARCFKGRFNKSIKLDWEKAWKVLVLYKKKKYGGVMCMFDKDGGVITKEKFSGIEVSRRDNCPFVPNTMEKCLKIIFEKGKAGVQESLDYAKKRIGDLRTGKITWDELIISGGLKSEIGSYKSPTPFSRLAQKINERMNYEYIVPGTRMKAVVVLSTSKKKVDKLEDPLYAWEHKLPLDMEFYLYNAFGKAMTRLYEPILYPDLDPDIAANKRFLTQEIGKKIFVGKHMSHLKVTYDENDPSAAFFRVKKVCAACGTHLEQDHQGSVCYACKTSGNDAAVLKETEEELEELNRTKIIMDDACQDCVQTTHYTNIGCKSDGCASLWKQKKLDQDISKCMKRIELLSF